MEFLPINQTLTEGKEEVFTPDFEPENLITESNSESETESTSSNTESRSSINDLLNEFTRTTPKDEEFSKGAITDNATTGEKTEGETTQQGTTATPPVVAEPRKKASLMFVKFIDFIISMVCSIIVDEVRDKYKLIDSDLKELAEAVYDYEQSTGKKVIASPLTSLILTFCACYGEVAYNVVKDYRAKKVSYKAAKPATIKEFEQATEMKVNETKKDGRGGVRPGSGYTKAQREANKLKKK